MTLALLHRLGAARRPLWLSLLSLACLLTLAGPADAQWRWRDKNGQINASDRPPPLEVPEKDILSRPPSNDTRRAATVPAPAASGAAASAPPTQLEREVQARKKAAEQEQATKAEAEKERVNQLKAENCRNARSQLATLESGQRIARMNEKGEREFLDDKGRADESRRAREVIASDCR